MNYIGVTYDKLPFYCGDTVQIIEGENAGLTGVVQKFNGFGCYVNVFQRLSRWYSYNEIKGMDKELNLCEILKGHEGETFYCSLIGENVKFQYIIEPLVRVIRKNKVNLDLCSNGGFSPNGECQLFPSKDQRDWNKWLEEQKPKVPKTWKELVEANQNKSYGVVINTVGTGVADTPIEKAALALLKIHQLIEVGYGGNVSKEKWKEIDHIKWIIKPSKLYGVEIKFVDKVKDYSHIAFNTAEQAKEFLKYPENVQLLKDYFMI